MRTNVSGSEKLDSWLKEYVEAAIMHTALLENLEDESTEATNKAADRIMQAGKRILGEGIKGVKALKNLLDHENPGVRVWAAWDLLEYDTKLALKVLNELATLPGAAGMEASGSLIAWKQKKSLRQQTESSD